MNLSLNKYLGLVLLHIGMGIVLFVVPGTAKILGLLVPVIGVLFLMRTQNSNNQALLVCSYIVALEVLMRMTNGYFSYEMTKYLVILFSVMGMFYSGINRGAWIYILFIALLLPGIYIGANTLQFDTNVRKAIIFNILGEVTLFFSALYCFDRRVKFSDFEYLLKAIALPIIATVVYLFLYTPSIKDVVTGTQSNFETSGGFGPNQVATILGLGMFVFFTLLILFSKTKRDQLINLFFLIVVSYRGIVTFSRGGIITALIMITILSFLLFRFAKPQAKGKIGIVVILGIVLASGVWTYSIVQTGGLIENRYANKDALGREKEDQLGGREQIAKTELQMFLENPLTGVGVGKNKEYREELTGIVAASHNETTRLLAEHGFLGILAILILIIVPPMRWFDNKVHLFLIPLYVFWALTISHAAMRLAAPAFIYALTLLKVKIGTDEAKAVVHRE